MDTKGHCLAVTFCVGAICQRERLFSRTQHNKEQALRNELPYNETELIARLAKGDHEAFQSLFTLWWDKVYSTALLFSKSEELARDTAQEVFLHLWKERAKMAEVDNPRAYLTVAARNMIFRKLSRQKLELAYQAYVSGMQLLQPPAATDQPAKLKELQQALEAGIRLLPQQQQRAFRLSREQGLTHEQIALEMGVSKQSVKDYIVKALAFLRRHLLQYGHLLFFLLAGLRSRS